MIKNYPINSLGNLLLKHNNKYGVELLNRNKSNSFLTNLTVSIPYFESKNTINIVLKHLLKSIWKVKKDNPEWKYEILLIDDGSTKYPAKENIQFELLNKIRLLIHPSNRGRYATRNSAIREAKYEFLLFIDADILINETILKDHLEIYARSKITNKNVITTSIFNFTNIEEINGDVSLLFLKTNDFRYKCIYRKSWIGSLNDKQYIGQKFEILKKTNNLNNWPKSGFLGPWTLSNMVLGGLFGVSSDLARMVGGCDQLFSDYGFEETSLVTKLIAIKKAFVIPIKRNYAIHVLDPENALEQNKKDSLFQKSHNIYFKKYLKYDSKESISKKL